MTVNGSPVITERFTEPGCYVTCFRDPNNESPQNVALFRGGLGDIKSSSMGAVAHAVLEVSEGEIAVGIVRTTRTLWLPQAVKDSINAREKRADSMENGIVGSLDLYSEAESIMLIGQSEGGVTVVDGMTRAVDNPRIKDRMQSMRKTVLTMEAPGVFGPVKYEGTIAQGLGRLMINCAEDLVSMSNKERMRMFYDATKRGISPFEIFHILGEISYLKDIDMSDEIGDLREKGVDVHHTFRDQDVVDGAEVDSEHSLILVGKHLRSLHGEGAREVAKHIVKIQGSRQTTPMAA